MTLRHWMLAICAGTNLYLLGVMMMFQRVVYPLFERMTRADFPAYYSAFGPRIALPVVVPEFLAFLAVLPLFWLRPAAVPAWSVYALFGAGVVYFGITFGLHLPVHQPLAAGDNSAPIIEKLVRTNGYRTWLQAAKCGLILWMTVAAGTASSIP